MKNKGKIEKENYEAQQYLDHLLKDGCNEKVDNSDLELPSWYDGELCKQGQSYVNKYRFLLFGGMLSGLIAVLAIPSILQVLICTKQSGNAAMAYRRYVRTIFHVLCWHEYPLKTGTRSWQSLTMVRKTHYKSSNICEKAKDGRITQKDMALTQFGFLGFICLGADSMGIDDPSFLKATVHFWRVIGHLLGIKDEYNLCTDSWETTRPRLEIVLKNVYTPALENSDASFNEMTKALIDGLWPFNSMLTYKSTMFITKRLAECKGYEFFDHDFKDANDTNKNHEEMVYYKLGLYDRFLVSYSLYATTYGYRYTLVRLYLNFRVWLTELTIYYLPYLAFYKFGFKWAYVRIFKDDSESTEKFHTN